MVKIVEHISDKVLKRTENKLLKEELLKIDGLNPKRVVSKNYSKGIIFLMNQMYKAHTLYITGGLQCYRGARRSQGDIFLIARYYYPDITFKEVRAAIFNAVNNDKYNTSYCHTIDKRVFWRDGLHYMYWTGYVMDREEKDELGFLLNVE